MIAVRPLSLPRSDQARTLRFPWSVLVAGLAFFTVNAILYFPVAGRIAVHYLYQAAEVGYEKGLDESDFMILYVVMMNIVFVLPTAIVAGLIGWYFSFRLNIAGFGRYAACYVLAVMPLLISLLPAINYAMIATRLTVGG